MIVLQMKNVASKKDALFCKLTRDPTKSNHTNYIEQREVVTSPIECKEAETIFRKLGKHPSTQKLCKVHWNIMHRKINQKKNENLIRIY